MTRTPDRPRPDRRYRRRLPRALPLVAIPAALLALAPAATAAPVEGTLRDRSGDAPAAVDVTRVDYASGPGFGSRLDLKVRDLKTTGRVRVFGLSDDAIFHTVVVRRPDGTFAKYVEAHGDVDGEVTDVRQCSGMRVVWRPVRNTIHLEVPQRCFFGSPWAYDIFGVAVGRGEQRDVAGAELWHM